MVNGKTEKSWKVVIPIQTIGFYNSTEHKSVSKSVVVIPIQTIGFYNVDGLGRLVSLKVVIPIQTIGFYNFWDQLAKVMRRLSYLSKR